MLLHAAELETQVIAVWQEVLGLSSLPSDITFFEAGGTSLLAARLACRLETALGRRVSAADLFVYPTPRELAHSLSSAEVMEDSTPKVSDSGQMSSNEAVEPAAQNRANLQRGAFAAFRPTRPEMGRA